MRFDYVRAAVGLDGRATFTSRRIGGQEEIEEYDESVLGWSDDEIQSVVANLFDCDPYIVEVLRD